MNKIRLVCFDLDGVLVNACDIHKNALNKALKETSNYEISDTDHNTIYNGLPTKKKLEQLISLGKVKLEQTNEIFNLKQKYTIEEINKLTVDWDKVRLHENLVDMRIKIYCVTNCSRETAELMLKKTGQFEYIQFMITNNDGFPPKPHSGAYSYAIFEANSSSSSTLIIEDSPHGIQAAEDSGCHILKVQDTSQVVCKNVLFMIDHINKMVEHGNKRWIFDIRNNRALESLNG